MQNSLFNAQFSTELNHLRYHSKGLKQFKSYDDKIVSQLWPLAMSDMREMSVLWSVIGHFPPFLYSPWLNTKNTKARQWPLRPGTFSMWSWWVVTSNTKYWGQSFFIRVFRRSYFTFTWNYIWFCFIYWLSQSASDGSKTSSSSICSGPRRVMRDKYFEFREMMIIHWV